MVNDFHTFLLNKYFSFDVFYYVKLLNSTPPNFKPNTTLRDKVVWVPIADGSYSVKSAFSIPRPKVPWYAIVGFKGLVSRWGFYTLVVLFG